MSVCACVCLCVIDVAGCPEELFELVRLSQVPLDYELFKVVSQNSLTSSVTVHLCRAC